MRKVLILLMLCVSSLLFACEGGTNPETKYILPDISGMSLVEAIVETNAKVELNPVYVKTNECLPDEIIGYGSNLKSGDEVSEGAKIDVKIAAKPENAISHDKNVIYVSEVAKITGPDSINADDLLAAGIYGTDLGIPVTVGDQMMLLFGDSFSGANMKGLWTSNFMTLTDDQVLHDGLTFTPITNEDSGRTIPFFEGRHQGGNETDNSVEVTKIPTGGITIGDTVYVFYMSIRYWGIAGSWNVNYNGVVKSNINDLKNWVEVTDLKWNEADAYNFGQIYPYDDPNSDYIYIYGIPGGRNGGCVVGRTTEANFLKFDEYEYLVAEDTWKKGDTGLKSLANNPYYMVGPTVAELSVAYNPYLGKYMMTFYRNSKIILMTSETPYGPFGDSITLLDSTDYNGIYGGFIHESYLTDGGKSFYMTVSSWETYNVYWNKVVLK